jgi:hypothetical protein
MRIRQIVVLTLAGFSLLAHEPAEKNGVNFYSLEKEAALGKDLPRSFVNEPSSSSFVSDAGKAFSWRGHCSPDAGPNLWALADGRS